MPQEIILREAKKLIAAKNLPKIRELLSSTNEIPDTNTISKILKEAADYNLWELVRELCQMQSDNKPVSTAIEYALNKTYCSNQLEVFKFICEQSINKPSQKNIENILQKSHTYPAKWNFSAYLCFIKSDYKPGQTAIDEALKAAADYQQWGLVREICVKTDDNKPSQSAIDYVLGKVIASNQLAEFKFICEQSIIKPSQKNISSILKRAHTYPAKWEFAEYICFLNTNYKPGMVAIDEALKEAVDCQQWLLVNKICEMKDDNKPSQSAIEYALGKAIANHRLDEFKSICEKGVNKPSQAFIESILKKGHTYPHKWNFVDYICFLNTDFKPRQVAIGEALKEAADCQQWGLVKKICEMKDDNKPSQSAIEYALGKAIANHRLEEFKFICEKSVNKPSQAIIEQILKKAHTYPAKWDFVDYLCFLNTDYKPATAAIDKVLQEAADCQKWPLVKNICEMKDDNKPSQLAIEYALGKAITNHRLEEFKFICEKSVNKPSQAIIERILKKAHTYPVKWDFVDYLCFLNTDYKPGSKAIEGALSDAADYYKWDLVKKIYPMESDNQPGQSAIDSLLAKAASKGQLEIVKGICELPAARCPKSPAVGNALVIAAKWGRIEIVSFFCEMKTENKPEPQAIIDAFLQAATKGRNQIVQYFCQLETENRPDKKLVGQALSIAASRGFLDIVKFLLGVDNPVKPEPQDAAAAFTQAITHGFVDLVKYFINPDNGLKFEQETMDNGLLLAITEPNGLALTKCFMETNKTTTIFSEKAVREALLKAKTEGKKDIYDFLLAMGTTESPSENPHAQRQDYSQSQLDIIRTLYQAVSNNDLVTVKNICAIVGDDKPKADNINIALEHAQQEDIKNCLLYAQKILKLHQHIAALESHGKKLQKEEESKSFGDKALDLANRLKPLTDNYAVAFFSGGDVRTAQKQFSSALENGFHDMGEHRAKWKIDLINIALTATVIGLFINYLVNGNAFFSNTRRQNEIQSMMADLNTMDSTRINYP